LGEFGEQSKWAAPSASGAFSVPESSENRAATPGSSRTHSLSRRCPLKTAPAMARQVFSLQFPQLDFSSSLQISKAFFG
jgi:hypothetical protein